MNMSRIVNGVVRAGARGLPAVVAATVTCAWFACPLQSAAQGQGGDLKKLAGVWHIATSEFQGQPRPRENLIATKATLTVTGSQFVFELELPDGTKAIERGTAVLNESTKPKSFDWNGTG